MKICSTCLSLDRKLVPIDMVNLGSLFVEIDTMKVTSVCWECLAIIHKLNSFKSQVLHAQRLLEDLLRTKIKPLSKLNQCNTIIHDICCEENHQYTDNKPYIHDIVMKTDDTDSIVEIKKENDDSDIFFDHDLQNEFDNTETVENHRSVKKIKHEKRKATDSKAVKKLKKVKVECNDSTDNKTENYTIIYMNDEELLAKWEADKQTKKSRVRCKYKCEFCISWFVDKNKYERHMTSRHSEKAGKHECHICKVRFMKTNNYKEHLTSHYRKYLCKCGYIGYELTEMAIHDAKEHGLRRFNCRICCKEFSSPGGLKYHRATSHVSPIKCETCGKMFKAKKYLTAHMKIHSSKPSQCHICGAKRRHMAAHMLKHKAKPESAYCAECDLRFSSIPVYKNHLKFAAKHRPPETLKYPCLHCDAKFVNSTALRKHTMVRHRKELMPHQCDSCDKRFDAMCRLRVHVLRDHEGVQRPKDKMCHICGRGFATKFMLSNHIRIHTGERPFRCALCPAAFTQKSSLSTHTRGVHLKIKPRQTRTT